MFPVTDNGGAVQIGLELFTARRAMARSLRDVSSAAGISAAYLQKLERAQVDEPSPRILRRLAEVLGIGYPRLMELAGYELIVSRQASPDAFSARLASSSLTETEENAVAAFIRHLVDERKNPEGRKQKSSEIARTAESKDE